MADPALRSPFADAVMPSVPGATVVDATGDAMWRTWSDSAEMGRIRHEGDTMAFSTSPTELTVVGSGPVPDHAVDLTHVRATLRIEGARSAELVMRLTPLDLTDEMFVTGSAARTHVAGITTEILRPGADTYLLVTSRSFARSLLEAITRAAETFDEK